MSPQVSRRSVAKGAAWSVPAVVAGAPAARAATSGPVTVSGSVCRIYNRQGNMTTQGTSIHLQIDSSKEVALPGGGTKRVVPAGTTIQWSVSVDSTTGYESVKASDTPNLNYDSTALGQGTDWTLTQSGTLGSKGTIIVTFKAINEVNLTDVSCVSSLIWPGTSAQGDPALAPGATIVVTTLTSGTPASSVTGQAAGLSWRVPRRASSSTRTNYAFTYISKSGAQSCYPETRYGYLAGYRAGNGSNGSECAESDANNTSTFYPAPFSVCKKLNFTSGQQSLLPVC